jgi:hypothetical protein
MAPESALALARLAFFGAAIAIFGWACFTGLLAPRRLGAEVAGVWRRRILAAGWLALAATLASLPLQAAMIGGAWASAGDA